MPRLDIITDPVTKRQYSRDLDVPGSTYAPYTETAPIKESAPGILPPLPATETGGGDLGNLRTALRSALSEAAQGVASSRIQQFSGLMGGGAAPSVIQAAIGLAQSGLKTSQETVFSDVMKTFEDQQDFALQLTGRYPDSGILPSDSWETAARKASRAPSFLKSLKGEPTVAEKEQGEARVSEAELERKRGEGGFVDLSEYRRMRARSLISPTEFDRRFTYFLSEGDQERIKIESASPTTRTAGDFTKGEQIVQANLAVIDQVGAGNMNQFVAQIVSIVQQETNLTEAEINQLIARYGFQKLGSVWVYRK